ncbi:hypothetical protein D3C75_1237880 [compost metagenome]
MRIKQELHFVAALPTVPIGLNGRSKAYPAAFEELTPRLRLDFWVLGLHRHVFWRHEFVCIQRFRKVGFHAELGLIFLA